MNRSPERQPVEHYLGLRYPVMIHEDEEGGFVAEIPDLPGCATQAETPDELFRSIEDAKRAWIEATYEDGREIPLPRADEHYSGKFIVRVPTSLHRRLAQAAAAEGVSLNQYVVHLLGVGVSQDQLTKGVEERLDDLVERAASAVFERSSRRLVGSLETLVRPARSSARGRRQRPSHQAIRDRAARRATGQRVQPRQEPQK